MIKVKNVRPGIVIIADAGLKLGAGEVAEISNLTPQTKKAVDDGLLARVDIDPESRPRMRVPVKTQEQPKTDELVLNDGKQQIPDEQMSIPPSDTKSRIESKSATSEAGTKDEPS